MVKSKVVLMILGSIVFSTFLKASWFDESYDSNGVKYTWTEAIEYTWDGLDEYGRHLKSHEKLGGHTIAKHVAKSFGELRARCSEVEAKNRYKDNLKTTFTTYNQAKWSVLKLIKKNRGIIDTFKASSKRGGVINARYVVNVQRKYRSISTRRWWGAYRLFYYLYGRGINCNLNVFNKVEYKADYSSGRPVYRTTFKDQYSRLSSATAFLKKKDGRWYIQTAYPSK